MEKKRYLYPTAFAIFTVVSMFFMGCTKKYYYDCPEEGQGENRITLSSEVQFGKTPRLQDEQIIDGQSLSLFVTKTGSTSEADVLYENNRITANGEGGFTYRIPMYYPSDGTNVDFYSVHPYYASASLSSSHPFQVQTDQTSQINYLNSDLLFGTETNVGRQENAVPLTFFHKLAKVDFTVTTNDPAIDLASLNTISVLNTLPQTSINVQNGAISDATGSTVPVISYSEPVATGNPVSKIVGYTAIIIPQTVTGEERLFELVLGEESRFYSHPVDYEFKSGFKYNITLDITNGGITIKSQIENWEEGGSIGGPVGPQ